MRDKNIQLTTVMPKKSAPFSIASLKACTVCSGTWHDEPLQAHTAQCLAGG